MKLLDCFLLAISFRCRRMQDGEMKFWKAFQNENVKDMKSLMHQLSTLDVLINGVSPLCMCVMLPTKLLVSQFLELGADPNFRNEDKTTALTASRDLDLTRLLLGHGASARFETNSEIGTSIHIACEYKDLASAKLLLDKGEANSCARVFNEFGQTPLGVAAAVGDIAMVKLLLQHGFPVDLCDAITASSTPLQLAIEEGHFNLVKVLVENGADKNLNHGLGRSPFQMAKDNPELQELLNSPARPGSSE